MVSAARWIGLVAIAALAPVLGLGAAGGHPTLDALPPGAVALAGETSGAGAWTLTVAVGEAREGAPEIQGLQVVSLPSGTVLGAYLDEGVEGLMLRETLALNPRAVSVGEVQGRVDVAGMPAPPAEDRILAVRLLREVDGVLAWSTVSEATLGDLGHFGVRLEPNAGGGGFRTCYYCGALFCGCITCASPASYQCCPGCQLSCQPILCP